MMLMVLFPRGVIPRSDLEYSSTKLAMAVHGQSYFPTLSIRFSAAEEALAPPNTVHPHIEALIELTLECSFTS
jgi:hypothetical protein